MPNFENDCRLWIHIGTATKNGVPLKNIEVAEVGEWDMSIPVSLDFPMTLTFAELVVEICRISQTDDGGENWPAVVAADAIRCMQRSGGCYYRGEYHDWSSIAQLLPPSGAKNG